MTDITQTTVVRCIELFEAGLFCAESVLQAIGEAHDIKSDLIPRIATGFCIRAVP